MQQEIHISKYLRIPVNVTCWNDLITHISAARLAKPKKLTRKQLELQDNIIKKKNSSKALSFAKHHHGKEGTKLDKLQDIVIDSKKPKSILNFALNIPGADIDKLQHAVGKAKRAQYIWNFAKYVPGADVKLLEKYLVDGILHAYYFYQWAEHFPDADIQAIAKKMGRGKDVFWQLKFANDFDVDDPTVFPNVFKERLGDTTRLTAFVRKYKDQLDPAKVTALAKRGGNPLALSVIKEFWPDAVQTSDVLYANAYNSDIMGVIGTYELEDVTDDELNRAFKILAKREYISFYALQGHAIETLIEILSNPSMDAEVVEKILIGSSNQATTPELIIRVCQNRNDLNLSKIKSYLFNYSRSYFEEFQEVFPDVELEVTDIKTPEDAILAYSVTKNRQLFDKAIEDIQKDPIADWPLIISIYPKLDEEDREIIKNLIMTTNPGNDKTRYVHGLEKLLNYLTGQELEAAQLKLIWIMYVNPDYFTHLSNIDIIKDGTTDRVKQAYVKLVKKIPNIISLVDPSIDEDLFLQALRAKTTKPTLHDLNYVNQIDKEYPGKYTDDILKLVLNFMNRSWRLVGYGADREGPLTLMMDFIDRNGMENTEVFRKFQKIIIDKILRDRNAVSPIEEAFSRFPQLRSEDYERAVEVVTTFPDVPGLQGIYDSIQIESKAEYNQFSKDLYQLKKLVEKGVTKVQDLKKANSRLMNRLKPLVQFNQGRPITEETIDKFEDTLEKFDVKITKEPFELHMQRSLQQRPGYEEVKQIVLKIAAGKKHLHEMEAAGVSELFDAIIARWKSSSHPKGKDVIGWVRLDISLDKEYVLVDEIQSDVEADLGKMIREPKRYSQILTSFTPSIKETYPNEESIVKAAKKLQKIIKNFYDIAVQTVTDFANKNGIKKIVWHTYEGGQALKGNRPPRSLYEKLPKDHYFEISEDERPFHLPEEFWIREATRRMAYRIALYSHLEGNWRG